MKCLCLIASLALPTFTYAATASPEHTVAYASFGPLNTAIFIADADGSNEKMLVANPQLDSNASFSADGQWVAFTSRRKGSADLYRVKTDGSHLERLTDDPAFDDQAAMSPQGDQVAFVSSRSGQAEIWLLNIRTGTQRNLTNHPGGDYRPAWSPDGQWLAFTSDRNSAGGRLATAASKGPFAPPQATQIFVMHADGSQLRQLTSGEASVGSAAWSPDGKQIVFFEASPADWRGMAVGFGNGPRPASQIVRIDVASGTRAVLTSGPERKMSPKWRGTQVSYIRGSVDEKRAESGRVNIPSSGIGFTDGTAGPNGQFSNVSWSPDRKRMIFHREVSATWPPVAPTFSRDSQFRLIRTGIFPSYSPDGRKLMFNTAMAAIYHNTIVIAKADGSDRQMIFDDTTQNAVAPVWSPDGDRIAFGLGTYNTGTRTGLPAHVAIMNTDGSALRVLTSGKGNFGFPSWSPDARRVVYRARNSSADGLLIMDMDSGKTTQLTSGPQSDNFPAWSPQGDLICFTSDRDGDWEIYTIRPDGTDVKRLTHSPGNDAHAAWSFDGKWIAFSSARGGFKDEMPIGEGGGQGAGDIFVMRTDGSDVRRLTDDAWEEATPAFAPR